MSILNEIFSRVFKPVIKDGNRRSFAAETDQTLSVGAFTWGHSERDRWDGDRETILQQSLDAWRLNPLARRIVNLTTQYVIGSGIQVDCKQPHTKAFLKAFWQNHLNRMDGQLADWCDELTRTGNLFLLISTDAAGMSYVRAVPTAQVQQIESQPQDIVQETGYSLKPQYPQTSPRSYAAWQPQIDFQDQNGAFQPVMVHYAVNRPVGALWGEPDLAPLLKWFARYASWLEDRARLNRFRTAYLYVVKAKFKSEAERLQRQRQLNSNPPRPGSILVCDESEEWSVLSPKLDSQEAQTDGLALKKMIACGAGLPMHFLAEPEGATRTTAAEAGSPTYRHLEQRQQFFLWLVRDLLKIVLQRRAVCDRQVDSGVDLLVKGPDLNTRDNKSQALAASHIAVVLDKLHQRGLIDDAEYLRLVYRFAGEPADIEELLKHKEVVPEKEEK